jgi:hypothetical protein
MPRSEDHRGRSRQRVCRREQWIADAEIAFAIIRPKNRHDEGHEANTATLAEDATLSAATIRGWRRTPPTALSGRHCVGRRPLKARTDRFVQDRWHASMAAELSASMQGDKAFVGNASFCRCLKTIGGARFALIPTRSSRRGSWSSRPFTPPGIRPPGGRSLQQSACCSRQPPSGRCSRRRPS